jgi:plasmid stabilization system protein ParE
MRVQLLPSAQRDLREIEVWVTENLGAGFTARTYAGFFKTFQLLADFPEMGRPRGDLTDEPLRFFLRKPYWIDYQPGSPVLIHRVYHAARDLNRMVLDED